MTIEELKSILQDLYPVAEALRTHPFWGEEETVEHLTIGFQRRDSYTVAKLAAVAVVLLADKAKEGSA